MITQATDSQLRRVAVKLVEPELNLMRSQVEDALSKLRENEERVQKMLMDSQGVNTKTELLKIDAKNLLEEIEKSQNKLDAKIASVITENKKVVSLIRDLKESTEQEIERSLKNGIDRLDNYGRSFDLMVKEKEQKIERSFKEIQEKGAKIEKLAAKLSKAQEKLRGWVLGNSLGG